jgi:hypothetical protein
LRTRSNSTSTAWLARAADLPKKRRRREFAVSCGARRSRATAAGGTARSSVQPVSRWIQRSWDKTDARNNGEYLKSGFVVGHPAGLVDAILDGFQPDPATGTSFFTQQAGGAIGRVAADATAFPHRRSTFEIFALVSWDLGQERKRHVDYVKNYWSSLLPFTDGYYTNEVADEHQPRIDENYRENIGRLR